ncbi:MAG: hypothetical protein HYR88_09100, partial [Verrucomicrobia bacterium]|nr:hypothetical protein [Verrucomicrobiota bacterium]
MSAPGPLPPPLPSAAAQEATAPLEFAPPTLFPRRSRTRRALSMLGRNLLGMFAVQSILGALMALGWTARSMQREGHKVWARGSGLKDWPEALDAVPALRPWAHWPTWLRAPAQEPEAPTGKTGRARAWLRRHLGGVPQHLKTGAQMLFNTAVLVLPATAMMQFAWYDGWNNSFNKGYEQAFVGPLISVFAILGFIAAMFHVPFAQARQALSGDWRRFYDFRLIRKLVRRAWLSSATLAAAYALLCVPLTVIRSLPTFFPQFNAHLPSYTEPQRIHLLNQYFFFTAAVFFPIFVSLHLRAARAYAAALLSAAQSGAVSEGDLAKSEWRMMNTLGLLRPRAPEDPPAWKRAARWFA